MLLGTMHIGALVIFGGCVALSEPRLNNADSRYYLQLLRVHRLYYLEFF